MIYPCETCLVDVVCRDVCDTFIFYSDYVDIPVPDYLVSTFNRFYRMRFTILKYAKNDFERVVRVDTYLQKSFNKRYRGKV